MSIADSSGPLDRPARPDPLAIRLTRVAAGLASRGAPGLSSWFLERLFTTPRRYSVPVRERDWMAGARTYHLELAGNMRIPLYRWGSGPTVLLIHGMSGRGSQMAILAAPLVAAGFSVVAFDAPGHGAAPGSRFSLPEYAQVIMQVAGHLGPLAGAVAHSVGAAAATVALGQGAEISRLVYFAPPEDMADQLFRLAGFLGFSTRVAGRTQHRLETRLGVPMEALRGRDIARRLTNPLLVFHDHGDGIVPFRDGATLARYWPGARLIATEGLGHARILRDPEALDRTVRFLSGRPTGQDTGCAQDVAA
ncbi:alpha/beta hydrolase [Ruegeria marina]|uniref:Lysophospholipase, alpha-beta hydrolase superfamily n=1 Tax=Ruegeria marina TaxID=639004 RepID=A0A1G7BAA9_9RHOB|nr:alpha/beta fold hydrolase [Ruegeria marina]SDE23951.1 Lysophospholipase, alpha-beta hydrolase superfamily [Ruegeria marina]